ncbi:MAG: DNA polymerase, partial [Oscillospiraceae bacterium]|nr:DNA polymerase [Oscillospiraceae bacterium]
AADIIKIAMVRVERRLAREGLRAQLILQVHDELVAEAPPEEAETVAALLREEMSAAATLSVPLEVEVSVGESWDEAH